MLSYRSSSGGDWRPFRENLSHHPSLHHPLNTKSPCLTLSLWIAASFWPWLRVVRISLKNHWDLFSRTYFFHPDMHFRVEKYGKFISMLCLKWKWQKKPFSPLGKSNKGLCIKRNEKHRRGVYKGIRFRLFRVCTWKTSETHCRGVKAQISKLACMTIVVPPRRTFEAVKGMCSANALHDSRVSRPGKAWISVICR